MKTADIITLHPGKQHNFEQAEQLINYFPSVKHITSLCVSRKTVSRLSFLPKKVLDEINKRSIPNAAAQQTDIYPLYELFYKIKRLSKKNLPYSFFKKRNEHFQKRVLEKYTPPEIFIGFDTSSQLIFDKWKGCSTLILDLTIAIPQYKRKLAEQYHLPESTIKNLTNGDEVWYETYEKELKLADMHWINGEPDLTKLYKVRTRYRAPLVDVRIAKDGDKFSLLLDEQVRAVTPGQSAVLYDGELVLGGGIVL